MKKVLITLLSVIVMFTCIFSLSACSNNDTSATQEEEYVEEGYVEEDTEEDYAEEEYLENLYKLYEGTRIFKGDGIYDNIYYLVKDGEDIEEVDKDGFFNFYKIAGDTTRILPEEYEYGAKRGEDNESIHFYSSIIDLPNGKPGFYTYGEIPHLVASNKDKVIIQTTSGDVPVLGLRKLEVYGENALPITYDQKEPMRNAYHTFVTDIPNHYQIELPGDFHSFSVTNSAGDSIEDFYDVASGDYTVSWYTGTTKEEMVMSANSTAFQYATIDDMVDAAIAGYYDYEVEATLKDNYAEFYLEDVPPGLYVTDNGGILEIE